MDGGCLFQIEVGMFKKFPKSETECNFPSRSACKGPAQDLTSGERLESETLGCSCCRDVAVVTRSTAQFTSDLIASRENVC